MFRMIRPTPPPEDGVSDSAVRRRLVWTWLQTLFGVTFMGSLLGAGLYLVGVHWSLTALILSLWMLLPVLGWYFSANIVRVMTGAKPADPRIPSHRRLINIVDRLYPKTGLPVKPPVYVSAIKLPNAFATGRDPWHSFIAATEGLLDIGLTDDELEGVIAHELAHVRCYDVAVNSLLAVMSSLFSILLATGLPHIFNPVRFSSGAPLVDKLSDKVRRQKKRFFLPIGGVVGFAVMIAIFYVIGYFTKFVSLFVARARESGADALAVKWTGKPCALSTALQKIVIYAATHSSDLRNGIITSGMTALLIVSPFDDPEHDPENEKGALGWLRRWWRSLGEHHPPVKKRLAVLDSMSGGSCPRLW